MISHAFKLVCCLLFLVGCHLPIARAQDEALDNPAPSNTATASDKVLLIVGVGGTDEFTKEFTDWAAGWRALAEANQWELQQIGRESGEQTEGTSARDQLKESLESLRDFNGRVWLVFIGHGTFTNGVAKFNLPGPDVTPQEVSGWAAGFTGDLIVIDCASASAPFMQAMSKPGRIVVTATRSGSEYNYARFGKFLAESIRSLDADLDHDDSVSLLEAFLAASKRTEEFYTETARLATEHALLDDNSDRVGTSHEFYRGVKPVKVPQGAGKVDGRAAAKAILFVSPDAVTLSPEQEQQRDDLESQIETLKAKKDAMSADLYYNELERLFLEVAELYEQASKAKAAAADS